MAQPKPKCPKAEEGAPDWLLTYGDMTTPLLTFFIMMFTAAKTEGYEIRMILAAFSGLGILEGGNTLQAGKMAELGNTTLALPSMNKGRALDQARRRAISEFQPEIKSEKVQIKEDERGLIISLAADAFFAPGSAEVDIVAARETLNKVAGLLNTLPDRKFRIEGHTDSIPTDPAGPFFSNWELSAARSANVLHYLVEYGADESQFQIAGFADTVPLVKDQTTEEARAKNRRVEIVILSEGHL